MRIIILIILLAVTMFFSVSKPVDAIINVSSCGVLAVADETYLLTQDVSSVGTCFTIGADDIILDLNNHTITYGTGTGEYRYGVALPPHYIRRDFFPDSAIPDSSFNETKERIRIQNGSIVQGGGDGENSHAIFGYASHYIYIHNLTITVHGPDTQNIGFTYSENINVYDNLLNNNSTVVTNRHQGRSVVQVTETYGGNNFYRNTITGGPQFGLRINGYDTVDYDTDYIYDNVIRHNATVANPYGISAGAKNMKVYSNMIEAQNGRGIHVLGDNQEIYNNTITVKEGSNSEYSTGWSHGIKIEEATNAKVHNNTVTAIAEDGFGHAYALDMTINEGANNEVYENIFTATTTTSGLHAAAAHITVVNENSGTDIHHNIFRTNNRHISTSWESPAYVLFRSNTFEIQGTPINYNTLWFETGDNPSHGLELLDNTAATGVSFADVGYRPAGSEYSYETQQYLNLVVQDAQGQVIPDAVISISDVGANTVANGTTNTNGTALFALRTHYFTGKPVVDTGYIPHQVTISLTGYKASTTLVTLDSSKQLVVTLTATNSSTNSNTNESIYIAPTPESTPGVVREVDETPIALASSFFVYNRNLRGGYHIAVGNVIGDSKYEIITGTGGGMGPHVRIFNNQGTLKAQFFAYSSELRNGVTVTACDIDGDGYDEIITAQGPGGWPLVKIFDGDGNIINNGFRVLDGEFLGGVNLSCGDTNGDGISEIVVAAMKGGGPHVLVYNSEGTILTNFMAYDQNFRGGINISTIDMDGDGRDEIVTGPQFGAPHVQIFQIRPNELKRLSPGFYAFSPEYRGGVSVAGVDTDGDGEKELLVGVGEDAQSLIKKYNIREELEGSFYAYGENFLGGVNLGGGDVDGDGLDEIIIIPRSGGGANVRVIEGELI
ncbi:MAG: FG-GAP-like repeat-containing protein [Candidatus Kerfeldbacteria bacterium]